MTCVLSFITANNKSNAYGKDGENDGNGRESVMSNCRQGTLHRNVTHSLVIISKAADKARNNLGGGGGETKYDILYDMIYITECITLLNRI